VYFDAIEREQLCQLFEELGPEAPTLLEGWTTRDLAAHLILRERDPIAAPGIVVPGPWAWFAERRRVGRKEGAFPELVTTVRSGPPLGPFRVPWIRRVPNLNEFFVHHEDVRRANGQGPRALPAAEDEALWHNVGHGAWFLSRRLRGAGLELEWAGRTHRARGGSPTAVMSGAPGELLLFLFGRGDAAEVELTGPAEAVAAVRAASFGM
jgi:uncharacterized protein (TIGR03085 family)